ncbi:MAG: methyl-accepting chemotaxis protein, partial [Rhizobiaceae bacterium]
ELGGDILNARQAYLGFSKFNVDAVDAYSRFATLLKVSEGRASAREVLGALRETNKTKSLELVWTQLLDDSQRAQAIDAFAKANPDFGPAAYALADEYSQDRLGARTLTEKRAEWAALRAFSHAEIGGGLVKNFVDQTVLAEWTGRVQSRLAALGNLDAVPPPSLNPVRAGQGWQVSISLPEPATAIFWRAGDQGDFTNTGVMAFNDQQTGKPMANPAFQLQGDATATDIFLKYTDLRGQEVGPFQIRFDPDASLIASQKSMIELTWTSWIAFDASGFRGNLYFTQLAAFSCGIKEVAYGFNGAAPTEPLKLPPCDPANPFALPDGFMPYFKIGEDVKSMSVEVTYADGAKSGVKEFKRP